VRAVELHAKAKQEAEPHLRAELEALAKSYVRLAEQADRNAQLDVAYETPPPAQPRGPQHQQIQPEQSPKAKG
jgi:hypothetical protein